MEIKDLCTVLVSSFDGFSDCWGFFVYAFQKYWKNCPWKVVLMTTGKTPSFPGIEICCLDKDNGWASNMKAASARITTPYILYMQEDYWLEAPVNTEKLTNVLQTMIQRDYGYVRVSPIPPADGATDSATGLGRSTPSNCYRVCLQAAIWKKEFLEQLLFDGESGWDFEYHGAARSAALPELCFVTRDNLLPYGTGTAIRKGRWTRSAIRFAKRENMELPYRKRENIIDEICCNMGGSLAGKLIAFPILRIMQCLRGDRKWGNYFK